MPKTGSSSIRALLGFGPKPHLDVLETLDYLQTDTREYPRALRVVSKIFPVLMAPYGRRVFDRYYKFGFVRNPWDRVVSLYQRNEGIQMRGKFSFEEFVEWIQLSSDTCVHPSPHRFQVDWFKDKNGKVVVDFIGRFEKLNRDWERIASRLEVRGKLPHMQLNPCKKQGVHYSSFYNRRTRQLVHEKFKEDIDYFGYEFGE